MKFSWKTIAALLCYALGVAGWIYLGGWLVLTRPLKGLLLAHVAGNLTIGRIFKAMAQGFGYLTAAGAVWCVGYMLSNYFNDHKDNGKGKMS
ncbi:MAG: phospho-N-acetylmuramoyl-pentapeptide-transferase [Roseburia sp.]|nr:phospho-N-acetylmuramoyl-pentapeptide-transferase [Roseburia sp.]